jgi:sulfate/thiosulfate transport system ATP-binding protein
LPAAWEQLHGQPVTPSGALGRAAYVRPHEIEVTRAPQGETSVAARVDQVLRLGSAVRLELSTADRAEQIEVELSKERQQQLGLARGDTVYIRPTSVRVFERKLEKIG